MTTQIAQPRSSEPDGPATVSASVAIVVPAYNEEANLPNLFRELETATTGGPHRYHVIMVDDGSADGTAAMAEAYAGPLSFELVKQGVNTGLGAAVLAGLRRAVEIPDTDVVVTIEADTTSDLGILHHMVSVVASGQADMAQGSMHHPDGVMVDVSGFRQLTSKVASLVMRIATGSSLHTFTNLYRAISVDALKRSFDKRGDDLITEHGFAGVTQLLLNMMRDGTKVVEVPITLDAAKRVDERQDARVADRPRPGAGRRQGFAGRLLRK